MTTTKEHDNDDREVMVNFDRALRPLRLARGTREIDPFPTPQPFPRASSPLLRGSDDLSLASIPDAVFMIDLNNCIVDINDRAEALVGYDRVELVGRSLPSVIANLESSVSTTDVDEHTRFLPVGTGAYACHRSGTAIPVEALICPHRKGTALVIVRATTARYEDEVAQIVHDLKSPLATIQLETELIDAKLGDIDNESLCRAVGRIMLNVGYLDRMIQDLLDACAIDAGAFAIHRAPTEMRTLVEQVLERVVATRDRERVLFHGSSRIVIAIDTPRIERVLGNLIQNALKYAPRSSAVVIRLDVTDGVVCIAVIDAGPGIPPEERESIFEKYRRSGSNAGGHEGSGLGLYVSKRIIEAHGGRIGVDSVHGVGSRFFFELPID
jgi:PAS domain S-box-containing protein